MDHCLVIVIEHIQAMIHVMTIFVLLLFSDINYFAVLSLVLRHVDDACSTKVTYLYHGAATRWETPSVHQPPVSAQEICSTKVTYLYHGACPPASRK